MVAVMANEQQQFESLVSQLMSPDNNIRNQAEVGKYSFFIVLLFYFSTDVILVHCGLLPRSFLRDEPQLPAGFECSRVYAMCNLQSRNCPWYIQNPTAHCSSWICLCYPFYHPYYFVRTPFILRFVHPRFSVYYSGFFGVPITCGNLNSHKVKF